MYTLRKFLFSLYMDIPYFKFLQESILEFIKKILIRVQNENSLLRQPLYISYRTDDPLVVLSEKMKSRYQKEITIILQYQFENLEITKDGFSMIVSFDGIKENIYVPFNSITSFVDSTSYSFKLQPQLNIFERLTKDQNTNISSVPVVKTIDENNKVADNVIVLDRFRKPNLE